MVSDLSMPAANAITAPVTKLLIDGRWIGCKSRLLGAPAVHRWPTISQQKRNSFDSLRLIFAVLVIFSHSFPLTHGTNAREPLARLAAPAMVAGDEITLGAVAVWAFFTISGFLITKSWQRSSSPWSYMEKRFRRIYPGFLGAVSFCALLQGVFSAVRPRELPGWWNFLSHAMQLQMFDTKAIFTTNPLPNVINGSLWSIPFEFWCYLGVLFLGLARMLKGCRWVVLLFLTVVACHAWIDYRHWLPGGMLLGRIFGFPLSWVRVLPFFLGGMFLALAEERVELRPSFAVVSSLLLVVATPFAYVPLIVYPIFGSYLLLYVALSPRTLYLNLGRWGDFSYGTYLYAFPIQQLIVHASNRPVTPLQLFFLATPLSIGAGIVSWFLIERRFLSRQSEKRREQYPLLK